MSDDPLAAQLAALTGFDAAFLADLLEPHWRPGQREAALANLDKHRKACVSAAHAARRGKSIHERLPSVVRQLKEDRNLESIAEVARLIEANPALYDGHRYDRGTLESAYHREVRRAKARFDRTMGRGRDS